MNQKVFTNQIRRHSKIAKELSIPFTVMGGIKEHHFHDLMKAGARKIAMVTAITQADDMMKACQNLRNHYQTTLKGICS